MCVRKCAVAVAASAAAVAEAAAVVVAGTAEIAAIATKHHLLMKKKATKVAFFLRAFWHHQTVRFTALPFPDRQQPNLNYRRFPRHRYQPNERQNRRASSAVRHFRPENA